MQAALNNSSAETTQACPDMLEVVSAGVNKWTGMRSLMASLGIPQAATMAMGDGMNDYPIVSQAAIGVAMGNAQPEVSKLSSKASFSNRTPCVEARMSRRSSIFGSGPLVLNAGSTTCRGHS